MSLKRDSKRQNMFLCDLVCCKYCNGNHFLVDRVFLPELTSHGARSKPKSSLILDATGHSAIEINYNNRGAELAKTELRLQFLNELILSLTLELPGSRSVPTGPAL